MRDLAIDVIRTFIALAETGSVTAAGAKVGRSQPAVSLQLKKLQDDVGVQLFSRKGHKLQLTEAGELFYDRGSAILRMNDALLLALRSPAMEGSVKLGTPSEFATTVLPQVIGAFAQKHPNVALEVVSDLSRSLLAADNKMQYDLILALADKTSHPDVFKTDPLVWVAGQPLSAGDGQTTNLVVAPEPCIYRSRALQNLRKANLAHRVVYTNPDLTGIKSALQAGMGVTVLARSVVPDDLVILGPKSGLPPLGEVGICLIYDKRRNNLAVSELAEEIASGLF